MQKKPITLGLMALVALSLSLFSLAAVAGEANAQNKVRWKMQSAFGGQLPQDGPEPVVGNGLQYRRHSPGGRRPGRPGHRAVAGGGRRPDVLEHRYRSG